MDYIDLGRRIRKQRTQRGWTQEALAERVNVSTSFVGHVERGTRKASLETLVSIANVLDVSLDYLLSGSINSSVSHTNEAVRSGRKRFAISLGTS